MVPRLVDDGESEKDGDVRFTLGPVSVGVAAVAWMSAVGTASGVRGYGS